MSALREQKFVFLVLVGALAVIQTANDCSLGTLELEPVDVASHLVAARHSEFFGDVAWELIEWRMENGE